MYENFHKLEEKKQKKILKAAMEEFSKYGYNKTSVEEIAKSAEISKSMVFYYFKSKLDLYNYLIIYSSDYIIKKYDNLNFELKDLDYLERYLAISKSKLKTFEEEKALFNFSGSIYLSLEDIKISEEASKKLQYLTNLSKNYSEIMNFEKKNTKLRKDIKKESALQYINWIMDGYSNYLINKYKNVSLGSVNYDEEWNKFDSIMFDLEKIFYAKGE